MSDHVDGVEEVLEVAIVLARQQVCQRVHQTDRQQRAPHTFAPDHHLQQQISVIQLSATAVLTSGGALSTAITFSSNTSDTRHIRGDALKVIHTHIARLARGSQ